MRWVYIPLLLSLVTWLVLPSGRLAEVLWAETLNTCTCFSLAHVSGNSLVSCYPLRLGPESITYGTYLNSIWSPSAPPPPNHIQPMWTEPHSTWRCLSLRVFAVAEHWVWRRFVMKLYCGNRWLIQSPNLPHFSLSILRCHRYRSIYT